MQIARSAQFKRDVKKAHSRNHGPNQLRVFLELLIQQKRPLPARYRDHRLQGNWANYRGHLAPDWLVIYRIEKDKLHLARTGSHSELFKG